MKNNKLLFVLILLALGSSCILAKHYELGLGFLFSFLLYITSYSWKEDEVERK